MNNKTLTFISSVALISFSGCATNDELFAKYDKNCDLPKAKIIEKVVEKQVIKEVVKIKQVDMEGLHWEPAVYFGFDKSNLNAQETKRLAQNVAIMKKYPQAKVNIQSFTDQKGSTRYNKSLATRREAMVVDYLHTMGIADNRILVSALGEELPILGDSVKDRQINRRVEMMLLDEDGRPMALKVRPESSPFIAPSPVR
ncbi:MAG: OmpA family protein [uncultured Thiotrichaceae bacterium]|uniref:OmpA family protein n=1 Tax=uncultured Thiotrichaceae bacterium TaxID=298394 RepID=A0A6S6TXJ4_9GAMM|nr:MAG: OmpA family protein [uncultured Thiotrichaceae bacterium]